VKPAATTTPAHLPEAARLPMRIALRAAGIWIMAAIPTACGGPAARADIDQAELVATPCEDCPEARELAKAADSADQLDFLRQVNALETTLTGRPLTAGNEVDLLRDGPAAHKAQLSAIRQARHHIHLITYILTDDKLPQEYHEALLERRAAGVQVRLMFDSVGGRTVGEDFLKALTDAGVEVRSYGSMNPLADEPLRVSRRHHRKILVVDGRVAFTGGINISDEYRRSSAGSGKGGKSGKAVGWRDTHIRIEGPAVAEFQRLFFESWQEHNEPIPPDPAYWPQLERQGSMLVRAVTQQGHDVHETVVQKLGLHDPDATKPDAPIYASYVAAITQARRRIWITQAYFIPNREFLEALKQAARRGVDVRLLVPSTSDISLMVHASRHHYAPLLEAGARIFEYQGQVLHAKTAVVDGAWATVGSSNLDYRSFVHNDEANAIILGSSFGDEMERMFLDDVSQATEILRHDWARRPWTDKLRQRCAALLKYWI
jgi:cardiolipin synthase A/B